MSYLTDLKNIIYGAAIINKCLFEDDNNNNNSNRNKIFGAAAVGGGLGAFAASKPGQQFIQNFKNSFNNNNQQQPQNAQPQNTQQAAQPQNTQPQNTQQTTTTVTDRGYVQNKPVGMHASGEALAKQGSLGPSYSSNLKPNTDVEIPFPTSNPQTAVETGAKAGKIVLPQMTNRNAETLRDLTREMGGSDAPDPFDNTYRSKVMGEVIGKKVREQVDNMPYFPTHPNYSGIKGNGDFGDPDRSSGYQRPIVQHKDPKDMTPWERSKYNWRTNYGRDLPTKQATLTQKPVGGMSARSQSLAQEPTSTGTTDTSTFDGG